MSNLHFKIKKFLGRHSASEKQAGFTPHLFTLGKNKNDRANKKGEGFTLIEILVVLGIFTVLGLLIVNVFLLSLRSQRQASFRQETLANLRFVMETMAQNIRTSEIDYSLDLTPQVLNLRSGANRVSYSLQFPGEIVLTTVTTSGSQSGLLTTADDVVVFKMNFFVDPPQDPFTEERCNIDAHCSSSSDGCTINDPDADIKDFRAGFCICSASNECNLTSNCVLNKGPAGQGLCLPFDRQPRVTISLGFNAAGPRASEQPPIYLQTTVSSRIYKR